MDEAAVDAELMSLFDDPSLVDVSPKKETKAKAKSPDLIPEDTSVDDELNELLDEDIDEEDTDSPEGSDEDEVDEDEDEEDTEEGDDSDDSEDDSEETEAIMDIPDDKVIKLEIDGEEVEVTGEELKNGYMRQSDYTKNSKTLEEYHSKLSEAQEKILERAYAIEFSATNKLEAYEAEVERAGGWNTLRNTLAPEQYEIAVHNYKAAVADSEQANSIIDEYQKELHDRKSEAVKKALSGLRKTNAGMNANTVQEMGDYLSSKGFTSEELLNFTNPNSWDMVLKAMKYEKAQSRTKKPKESTTDEVSKPKHAPAKKAKPVTRKSKVDKAVERLRKTSNNISAHEKSINDAFSAIL